MNNKRFGIFVLALLLGLVGWGVYWFIANYERQYREIRVGVSAEARRNPFLAAERFLGRLGLESESIPGREYLLRPPDQTGALLVNRLSPNLSPEHEQALLKWIEGGGHLIVTANQKWDEEEEVSGNPLLERFGVRLRVEELGKEPEAAEEEEPKAAEETADATDQCEPCKPLIFSFPGYRDGVRVAFQNGRWLEETTAFADWAVEGEAGPHLLQFRVGQGRLTVLSDHNFLVNDHIGEQDHALFLALLTEGEPRVWLLYSSRMPSLLALLWRAVPHLVLSLALLIGLWLWSLTLRTGPLLQGETRVRRNLVEHLDAAANYAWQTDRAGEMFRTSQKVLEQGWRRRQPGLDRLTPGQRCERIAELAGMAGPAVEAALYGRVDKEQTFIRVSAVQQELLAGISTARGLSEYSDRSEGKPG